MYDFESGFKAAASNFHFNDGKTVIEEWKLLNQAIGYFNMVGFQFIIPPFVVKTELARENELLYELDKEVHRTSLIPSSIGSMIAYDNHRNKPMGGYNGVHPFRRYCVLVPAIKHSSNEMELDQSFKIELVTFCKPENKNEEFSYTYNRILNFYDMIQAEDGEINVQPAIPDAVFMVHHEEEPESCSIKMQIGDREQDQFEVASINTFQNDVDNVAYVHAVAISTSPIILARFGRNSDEPIYSK